MSVIFETRRIILATWLFWSVPSVFAANGAVSLLLDHEASIAAVLPQADLPIWSWGRMIRVQYGGTAAPVISSFDESGLLQAVTFAIPDAYRIVVSGFAGSPDGTLALCGWSADEAGRLADFVATITSASPPRVIRTSPYSPHKIAVASDGSLWTVGGDATAAGESKTDYDVLRHYDRNGKLLGSAVRRSTFPSPVAIAGGGGRMAASSGRVGWYTGPLNGRGSEYIEVRQDGSVLRVPGVTLAAHERVTGFAMTDTETFVSTDNSDTKSSAIYSVNDTSRSWQSVALPGSVGRIGWLYGGEGDRVVATGNDTFAVRFFRPQK